MSKNKSARLPKRIAGVKIPKKVRKSRFGRLLASPQSQTVLAEALAAGVAVGGAMVSRKAGPDSVLARTVDRTVDGLQNAKSGADQGSQLFARALGEAARSFSAAMQNDEREADALPGESLRRPERPPRPAR
jgi:hypothetical protein